MTEGKEVTDRCEGQKSSRSRGRIKSFGYYRIGSARFSVRRVARDIVKP